jgi:DNA-binding CsgD family transcriptional regulator
MACVLDEPFSVRELALTLSKPEGAMALRAREAVAAGWLVDDGEGLRFTSDRVRTAARDDLVPSVWRSLRRVAGRALGADGAAPHRVARMFEIGAESGDREAIDWLIRGARARAGTSPEESIRFLRRATDLCERDEDRIRVSIALAEVLTLSGRADEAADVVFAALGRAHDREAHLRLVTALARARRAGGRPADAARVLEDLLERPEAPGVAVGTRARLLSAKGDALVLAGRLAAGDVAANAGLDLALLEADETTAGVARSALARSRLWRGDIAGALELSATAADAALLGADEAARGDGVYLLAMHLMHADRFAESEALFRRELAALENEADLRALVAHRGLGFIAYHRGRWPEARSSLDRGWSEGRGRAVPMDLIPSLAILAVIDLGRGRPGASRGWVDAAFDEVLRSGTRFSIEWPLWARALLHEAEGELAAAAADAREALAAISASGTAYRLRFVGADLVRLGGASGDISLAMTVADRLTELAAGGIDSFSALARLCKGMAAADPANLQTALELYRRTQRTAELAAALEAVGTFQAQRDGLGREQLVEALSIYEAMGSRYHAARIRATLRHHGWRLGARAARRRATSGWASLTDAERAIARLVGEGLTNRQIATRLFVSPRTVESHVGRLRAKLGAGSRVAIAGHVERAADGLGH